MLVVAIRVSGPRPDARARRCTRHHMNVHAYFTHNPYLLDAHPYNFDLIRRHGKILIFNRAISLVRSINQFDLTRVAVLTNQIPIARLRPRRAIAGTVSRTHYPARTG